MIHYSCDRCQRTLASDDVRYVVRMEVQATLEDDNTVNHDRDHLLEVQEILERLDDCEDGDVDEELYLRRSFDLCAECREALVENPLGKAKSFHNLPFSAN